MGLADNIENEGDASAVVSRATATPRRLAVSPETYSFLLFCALSLSAVAIFPDYYVLFLVILTIDGIATLANSDTTVEVARSAYFLALLIPSVAQGRPNLLLLFLEVALVLTALDFSFLLRRIRGTVVDPSVLRNRIRSYGYTVVPTFLLSYALTYFSSFISDFALPDPILLLAASATAALFVIYVVTRLLSSRSASGLH
ncbi:MAG: hypothetical protein ABSA72_02335 [Nitrososphaerales archaeon]|jgi:hypothetical protein